VSQLVSPTTPGSGGQASVSGATGSRRP
jgi:hypothetical protein